MSGNAVPDCGTVRDSGPTVVVIGDVLLYREGVCDGLRRLGGLQIVAAIGSGEVAAMLASGAPDVVIVDASRQSTLDCARAVARAAPRTRIIGFGIGGNDEALACAEAGIGAFVGETGTIADILEAALRALRGEAVCSPQLTARLIDRLASLSIAAPAGSGLQGLTRRESEIARLVGEGLSNKEIAGALRISPATVKNHVHMILEKLALERRSSIGAQLRGPVGRGMAEPLRL